MSADDALLAEIVELTKNHTGATQITTATRLYGDLGMTGDDAHEFLLPFAVKYDVDLSGLIWLRYFDDESSMNDLLIPAFVLAASGISPRFAARWQAARAAEREVTIEHLATVARARTWKHPDAAHRRRRSMSPLVLFFSALSMVAMGFFVMLGVIVAYALVTGQLGQTNPLALAGVVAVSVLPLYLAFASWRAISHKLASAEGG